MVLLSSHNICFGLESKKKIIFGTRSWLTASDRIKKNQHDKALEKKSISNGYWQNGQVKSSVSYFLQCSSDVMPAHSPCSHMLHLPHSIQSVKPSDFPKQTGQQSLCSSTSSCLSFPVSFRFLDFLLQYGGLLRFLLAFL